MTSTIDLEPEIAQLRDKMRATFSDAHITQYDDINENGDKIRIRRTMSPHGTEQTIEENLSKHYGTTPSTTGDVQLLIREAKIQANSGLQNAHIPVSTDVMQQATEAIKDKDLTPAWEVIINES